MSPRIAPALATTLPAQAEVAARSPDAGFVRGATLLVLRWSISPAAAAAAGLMQAGDAGTPELEVGITWEGAVEGVSAAINRGGERDEVAVEGPISGAWTDDAGGVRHLDIAGLLRLSVVLGPDRVRVLYARTEVLGRLGLPGGRYDLDGATLICPVP